MTRCDLGFPAAEAVPVALAKKPGNSRASSSSWDALRIQLSSTSELLMVVVDRQTSDHVDCHCAARTRTLLCE